MNSHHFLVTTSILALLASGASSASSLSHQRNAGSVFREAPARSQSILYSRGRAASQVTNTDGLSTLPSEHPSSPAGSRSDGELQTTQNADTNRISDLPSERPSLPTESGGDSEVRTSQNTVSAPQGHGQTNVDQPRRRTIEQDQADAWDRGEVWHPPVYNPNGESSFLHGVREDKAHAQDELTHAENERHDSTLPDYAWDQVHGDPIGHSERNIQRRNWMIAIYEDAYFIAIDSGMSNLAAHAYAQIQLDKWRDKTLEQFEQTFGTHYAQLGQALSGDSFGNFQRVVAEGVPVTVVRTVGTTVERATSELDIGAGSGTTIANGPPPVQGPSSSIMLTNERAAAWCAKSEATPGWYSVFVHSDGESFGVKLGKKAIRISAKMLKSVMLRTGYAGGPVILNSCRAGSMAEGAAQQLADELGETVLAPTTKVYIANNGQIITPSGGVWQLFYPTLSATR